MRSALRAAVRWLLADPRLAGACDLVRLTAVILLAKAPVASAHVHTMARDLAGWLGYGVSHVGHTVVPQVRASGVATCERARDAAGWTHACDFELLPLREARAEQGLNPLSLLGKKDLATMLHFCEAVLCPGWAPKDKPATPPGFMAARRGRGSATDRLAMLLLALEAREDGSVPMAPGRLPKGYNRAEATVARLLGRDVDVAVGVLERLLGMGAVAFDRPEKFGQDRLLVPAIRSAFKRARTGSSSPDAHGTDGPSAAEATSAEPQSDPCALCGGADEQDDLVLEGDGWAQMSFEELPAEAPSSACGDQDSESGASSQVDPGFDSGSGHELCADPHANHPPVAALSTASAAALDCFSGSAVLGQGRLRESAGAGEETPPGIFSEGVSSGKTDPLRGEQHSSSPKRDTSPSAQTAAFITPVEVPQDLAVALAPVAWLWARLGRASTGAWLARAVRLEVVRLRSFVGDEDAVAQRRLAQRIKRRLDRQGTRPVQDLAGWMMKRGLPQNRECWSMMCDDGIRIDTGGACDSCSCRIGDRRGLRQVVAGEVATQHPFLAEGEWRAVYEGALRRKVRYDNAMDLARRERTAERQVAFRAAVEEQKAAIAADRARQAALPCADCGIPGAAGLCMPCTLRRSTVALVDKAVDLAVALRAEVDDPPALAALTEQITRDTWSVVRRAEVATGPDQSAARAFAEQELAKRVLEQRRQKALERLRRSQPAEMEAAHVRRMSLRGMFLTEKNLKQAEKAADKARDQVAHQLLGEFLSDLYRARAGAVDRERQVEWSERCTELAARPLAQDTLVSAGAAGES
ncbi:hypothetical protein OG800_50325 (plasmid) [Streptomyces sp. NBC_00445]|uniref:hypothetical protein n=1 Tax=Streptomyces sp. NBC_00445 TaxID=2975745 RepID=UPI002E1E7FF7